MPLLGFLAHRQRAAFRGLVSYIPSFPQISFGNGSRLPPRRPLAAALNPASYSLTHIRVSNQRGSAGSVPAIHTRSLSFPTSYSRHTAAAGAVLNGQPHSYGSSTTTHYPYCFPGHCWRHLASYPTSPRHLSSLNPAGTLPASRQELARGTRLL